MSPRRLSIRSGTSGTWGRSRPSLWRDYAFAFLFALAVALLVRTFLLEAYKIPADGMYPTLVAGDCILVNKWSRGLTLPWVDLQLRKPQSPHRGDVVVITVPQQRGKRYVKRILGLPGDEVVLRGGFWYLAGQPLIQKPLEGTSALPTTGHPTERQGRLYPAEIGGHRFQQFRADNEKGKEAPQSFKVPGESLLVIGDNLSDLDDTHDFGFVPIGSLVGKALFVSFSYDKRDKTVRWERIGKGIN